MVDKGINRLPVVDYEEHLLGIVTRSDLVRAFVRPDTDLAEEIRQDVLCRRLWLDPDSVKVEVDRGRVRLTGLVETQTDAELIPIFVRRVPGVVSVVSRLSWLDQNGRLDHMMKAQPEDSGRSPHAPTTLVTYLTSEREAILAAALEALSSRQPSSYPSGTSPTECAL